MQLLDFNTEQKISYCISNELRDIQIKINCKKVSGRLGPKVEEKRKEKIAIVCFGPSLKYTWEELKNFDYIMTCSGAHKFLIEHGIIPTWHLDLEPREHKIQMLGTPHKDVEYLIASTVHPRYCDQLQGYNVKLWHIFATDDEAIRVLPKGEFALTGGSSVGLRCMTMARYFGFTNLHIFGMDGSMLPEASHTTEHPNTPPKTAETEFNGKKYLTTPSMLFCAKETFKELNQMSDIKATFYGEGLVQDMAKEYKANPQRGNIISFSYPELISKEDIELNRKLHEDVPTFGMGGAKHVEAILAIYNDERNKPKLQSILDYGCGKGMLQKALSFPIWQYDPAIEEYKAIPKPADLVVCTDVLEHIAFDKIELVLQDLQRCTLKVGYFVISTRKAIKTYANGKNTHAIVKGKDWWNKQLSKHFNVGTIVEDEKTSELRVIVGVKIPEAKQEATPVIEIEFKGKKVKFAVPNETIKWRCNTLLTKEKITVEWIGGFKEGETLIDIGANMGGYSILAGSRGVKVIAFEPEADNYALLQKNIILNNINGLAYCAAITDKQELGTLHLSSRGVGGSCHSFGEGKEKNIQGCLGLRLDDLGLKADHIKIDVDGFEPKVIAGAERLLMNGVKSVLVEVNTNLPEHLNMVDKFIEMGFEFNQSQVDEAIRKDGPFKGCAEYLFTKKKTTPLIKHIIKQIENAELKVRPYKSLYAEGIFTDNVYNNIIENLPEEWIPIEKSRGTKGYPLRFTANPNNDFWKNINNQLLSGELKRTILKKFNIQDNNFIEDLLLIRDLPGYSIPPHTDATSKIISALFYLPETNDNQDEGTCIYMPKQEGFECITGRHYNFEDFVEVSYAPFKRNSVFIFARKNNSFHGVPPCEHIRNVLLYNIKIN